MHEAARDELLDAWATAILQLVEANEEWKMENVLRDAKLLRRVMEETVEQRDVIITETCRRQDAAAATLRSNAAAMLRSKASAPAPPVPAKKRPHSKEKAKGSTKGGPASWRPQAPHEREDYRDGRPGSSSGPAQRREQSTDSNQSWAGRSSYSASSWSHWKGEDQWWKDRRG